MSHSPKDKEELVLNPVTGEPDMVRIFNPDRIVTSERNAAGQKRLIWDAAANTFIEDGPVVVTDLNGNVVVV